MTADRFAEFTARNPAALKALVEKHGVELRSFPAEVTAYLRELAEAVIAELAASDPLVGEVAASFNKFRSEAMAWHEVSEVAFYDARRS